MTTMNNAVGPQGRQRAEDKRPRLRLVPTIAAASLLGGLQTATQFFAHAFGYDARLGINIEHVYAPWSILSWAARWGHALPQELMEAGSAGTLVAVGGLFTALAVQMIQRNTPVANQYMHGSARWATERDIRAAGLMPRDDHGEAVIVGGWLDAKGDFHYLRHTGPEHVLTYAPTRSGKGVALVVPTLLTWLRSCVISDLKGELWEMTAGWRRDHARNKVLKFEPAAPGGSAHWNALDEVRLGTEHEVGDVQNIAQMVVDPDGRGMETHWQKTSFALLQGVILHALYKAENGHGPRASLPLVDHMVSDPNAPAAELWQEMLEYEHTPGQVHPVVGAAARDQIDRHEEEAGSVLSSMKSYLALYRDPVVARNVGDSDFRIRDLMHGADPVSLYLVTKPIDKARLRPLMRLMSSMVIRILADDIRFKRGRPAPSYKHRLLMMLDELPALGKLSILQESLAFLAGYGIKCYLIAQDINQLKSREEGYGPDETITSNCHIQNAFSPNRIETAEYLSRCTGQTTVVKEAITISGSRSAVLQKNVSRTMQEVQRNLLTADECMRMPGAVKNEAGQVVEAGDMVVYVAGRPAIYGRQPLYFMDPVLDARSKCPAPRVSDKLVAVAP